MEKVIYKFLVVIGLASVFVACEDNDDGTEVDEPTSFADIEDEWVRLSLIHENGIEVMQAANEQILGSVDTGMPEGARYYSTNSGRYLTVINRGENETRFFDTGVINHEDHGHQHPVGRAG